MSEKNVFDDDFEMDFLDDEPVDDVLGKKIVNKDSENQKNGFSEDVAIEEMTVEELEEEYSEDEEMYEESEDDIDQDFDEDSDDSDESDDRPSRKNGRTKGKLSKQEIINRVMIGLGIVIGCFTIFYGTIFLKAFLFKDKPQEESPVENQEQAGGEELPPENNGDFFVSKNTDEMISQDIKDLLNDADLDSMKTGYQKIDEQVTNILNVTCKDDMSQYDKVRNIYDYLMESYELRESSYVDSDTIYDYCSGMNFISDYDMEMIYRAGTVFSGKRGDSLDFAAAFAIILRNVGYEAYFIDGEMMVDSEYEDHGYTVVEINKKYYIFDPAEEKNMVGEDGKVMYNVFCKTFTEMSDKYKTGDVSDALEEFKEFETLGDMSFSVKVTTSGGDSTKGSVNYSGSGNTVTLDELEVDVYDKVYLSGSVTGSSRSTWKLIVKVYDKNKNYITESTLYSETNSDKENDVSYTPARGGYMKLVYMGTDENGRTSTSNTMIKVNAPEEEETTTKANQNDNDDDDDNGNNNNNNNNNNDNDNDDDNDDSGNKKPVNSDSEVY